MATYSNTRYMDNFSPTSKSGKYVHFIVYLPWPEGIFVAENRGIFKIVDSTRSEFSRPKNTQTADGGLGRDWSSTCLYLEWRACSMHQWIRWTLALKFVGRIICSQKFRSLYRHRFEIWITCNAVVARFARSLSANIQEKICKELCATFELA